MLAWPATGRPSYDWQRTTLYPVLQDGPALGDERMQFGVLSEVSLEPSAWCCAWHVGPPACVLVRLF